MTGFEWFWLIIGLALLVTGGLVWLADEYSPFAQLRFWAGVLIVATVVSMLVPGPSKTECRPHVAYELEGGR